MTHPRTIRAVLGEPSVSAAIDAVCGEFEAAWRNPPPPRIRDYLERCSAVADRHRLLVELVAIDLVYRWKGQDSVPEAISPDEPAERGAGAELPSRPTLDDYLRVFPELGPITSLPEAFCRLPSEALGATKSLAPDSRKQAGYGWQEFPGTSRFTVRRRIGAGGMGVVFEAYDHEHSQPVAIKALPRFDPTGIHHLKNEFRGLADLVHPNLVRLYDLHFDADQWFFTMELVEGVDLLSYVREKDSASRDGGGSAGGKPPTFSVAASLAETRSQHELDGQRDFESGSGRAVRGLTENQLERLRDAMGQLARAIAFLHEAKKLHRDIKPANVMVTPEGRVVLLDFGLVSQLAQRAGEPTVTEHMGGTIAYMAPEQMIGQELTPAADWYAFGVVLFEALTDRKPFLGTHFELMRQKQEHAPPRPASLVSGVPEDLDLLCMELLARDPGARPKDHEVLKRLGAGTVSVGVDGGKLTATEETVFVGRHRELAILDGAWQESRNGQVMLSLVHGPSGMGKTALVEQFLAQLRRRQCVVLRGRCYERESVPYKGFDSLIDSLGHYLTTLPESEVSAVLPRNVGVLLRLFPVLGRVGTVAAAPQGMAEVPDRQELQQRAFCALRELLARLGDRKPLVLSIDDFQWTDSDSVLLLKELVRPPDPPLALWILSYRHGAEGVLSSLEPRIAALQAVEGMQTREIEVGPLEAKEAYELADTLAKSSACASTEYSQAIAKESQGNPYFLQLLAREQNSAPERCPDGSMTLRLDEVLWSCVQRLDGEARWLLEILAVAGHPLRQIDALEAADLTGQGREALAILRAGHFIRTGGDQPEDEIEPYHDRVRESVFGHLADSEILDCHGRIAKALQRNPGADPAVLAEHLAGAQKTVAAIEQFAAAAGKSAELLAFGRAAELYQRALGLGPQDAGLRQSLEIKLADAWALAGHGHEAAEAYLAAAGRASGSESLELQRRAAIQFLISGSIDQGFASLQRVLRANGMDLPASNGQTIRWLLWRRLLLWLRGLRFQTRAEEEVDSQLLEKVDLCSAAATGLWLVDPVRGGYFHTRALLLALRAGEPRRLARLLPVEGMTVAALYRNATTRVDRILRTAAELAERTSDAPALGRLLMAKGIVASLQGQWSRNRELSDQAEAYLRNHCQGAWWELDSCQGAAILASCWIGDFDDLARRLATTVSEAKRRGNLFALASKSPAIVALLAADRPGSARRVLEDIRSQWCQEGFHVQHQLVMYCRVLTELYCGDVQKAWNEIDGIWPVFRRSLLHYVRAFRMANIELRGRCAIAMARSAPDPRPWLVIARRAACSLRRENAPWLNLLGGLLEAQIAIVQGRHALAAELLRELVERLASCDMRLFAMCASCRLGEVIGGEEGATLVEQADDWFAQQGVRNPQRMVQSHIPVYQEAHGSNLAAW